MYSVSENYLSAIRKKTVADRISGTIILPDGTDIDVSDENLVKDSLRLTKELCGDRYAIGTFNLSHLTFSIFFDNALGLDLTGAKVTLTYSLMTGENVFENVPLGTFLIDPVLSVRQRDVLTIDAYDVGIRADIPPSDTIRDMVCRPASLIAAVCADCGIDTDIVEGSLDGFPNSNITVSVKDRQIQSCRDIIMWCCTLLCGYAVIDRNSKLAVIPAKYATEQNDSSSIVTSRTIREDERDGISVTDTRAYIKYLTAYKGDDIANYTSSYIPADEQASPAAFALEKNPLLKEKNADECDAINRAWLSYIDGFKQRGIRARIFGDPAIDTGDTVMFRGGDVDQRRGVVGIVTSYEWRYRSFEDLICTAPECVGSLRSGGVPASSSSKIRSQTSKRIDAVTSGETGGVGEFLNDAKNSERFNDYSSYNTSNMNYDHVEGYHNKSTATSANYNGYNHLENGYNEINNSSYIHIEGYENDVSQSAYMTHIEGSGNDVHGGGYNHIQGERNTSASNTASDIGGRQNSVSSCEAVIVRGYENTVTSCSRSSVCGRGNTVTSSDGATIGGEEHTVTGALCSAIFGEGHVVNSNGWRSLGAGYKGHNDYRDNKVYYLFIGGGGWGGNQNIFTVDTTGNVQAAGSITPGGADYAEYFEWSDGNPENEDRRGMLVMLDGDRIVPASGNRFFGIVSSVPSVIGNSAELYWSGKYRKDVFGNILKDEENKPLISESYDSGKVYVPRSQRSEWAAVGLVGRLVVTDDGSCTAGCYIAADNGIAHSSRAATKARMLRRIDETHIEVLLK